MARPAGALDGGLVLIDSDASRSAVYHALKDYGPPGAPILVAALHDAPKLAHMPPGVHSWSRRRV